MTSTLIMKPVDKIQVEINGRLKKSKDKYSIYISLNKPHKSLKEMLEKEKINTDKTFFIDCISTEKERQDQIIIHPTDTKTLIVAIKQFIKRIPEEKQIIIDTLSTLLIYNNENKVAQTVKELTELGAQKNIEIIAYSPKTKGEELLNKIFNFFDDVKR